MRFHKKILDDINLFGSDFWLAGELIDILLRLHKKIYESFFY
jgi:hypothetical protein